LFGNLAKKVVSFVSGNLFLLRRVLRRSAMTSDLQAGAKRPNECFVLVGRVTAPTVVKVGGFDSPPGRFVLTLQNLHCS
jgi:hypothetical protein